MPAAEKQERYRASRDADTLVPKEEEEKKRKEKREEKNRKKENKERKKRKEVEKTHHKNGCMKNVHALTF